nr:GH92 family glycosyl hydrolase [Streptomyces sp. SID5468]
MRSLAAGVVALAVTAPGTAIAAHDPNERQLAAEVNPFTGTRNQGNTFPGATVPFGMVQVSPDTGHFSGYGYDDTRIRGFSQLHLSGAGCAAGGDVPLLPTTGAVTRTDDAKYAASFTHAGEQASPGYYRVRLSSYGGITAELTATTRTGWQRYTFPATRTANVLINAGQALHKVTSSKVTVLDDRTVAASVTGHGFCADTRPYTVYTVTRFSRPFTAHGLWQGTRVTPGARTTSGGGPRGGYVRFDTRADKVVTAVTGVSWTGLDGARRNLDAEGGGTFNRTSTAARRAWEQRLATARVHGGTPERRRTFYTALYHALLAPNTGSDTDGAYTGYDRRIHHAEGFTYYQNFSLWDTYRTQAQLLALLAPRELRDASLSLLRIAEEGGWLPKWGLGTVETNTMTGDPVTPFLVSAFHQGLLAGHEEEAYRALKRNADGVPSAASPFEGRGGNPAYLRLGYVPYEPKAKHKPGDFDPAHGPSATLEYALADAALGTMAQALGHDEDARRFRERGRDYRNVFDRRTGFFRARDAKGAFTGPADPKDAVGFHEGTAWQYQWLVPQDLPGMFALIGGRDAADKRLDAFFAYPRLLADPDATTRRVWVHSPSDYYHHAVYNPDNEPDLGAPYTYLSTGRPWKTADVVRGHLSLFSDRPDGITGNDDLGTMSAWAVLSCLGLYPVQPGSPVWGLTTPAFDRVELTLDRAYFPHGRLVLDAPGADEGGRYLTSVRVAGHPHRATYLTTADLRAAHEITLTTNARPSDWGTRPQDAPRPTVG